MPSLTFKSDTRIDTGRWWRSSPIRLTVTENELTLEADGPRPFRASVPLAECHASRYHHATGKLIVEPAELLPIRRIRLNPQDALRILSSLKSSPTHASVC